VGWARGTHESGKKSVQVGGKDQRRRPLGRPSRRREDANRMDLTETGCRVDPVVSR
jgi:hypothetical protein